MKDIWGNAFMALIVLVIVYLILVVVYKLGHGYGYKDGQIDYHNKVIKYSLVTDSRGETTWAEVKK